MSCKKHIFQKSIEQRRSRFWLFLGCTSQRKAADGDVFCAEIFSHTCLAKPQTSVYKQEDEPSSY